MDLDLADDPEESFRLYQGMIRSEYDQLVKEFDLVRIDAMDALVRQQKKMRSLVAPHLKDVMRADGGSINDALREEGLLGRYLDEARSKKAQA
jgi:dTMP kinase